MHHKVHFTEGKHEFVPAYREQKRGKVLSNYYKIKSQLSCWEKHHECFGFIFRAEA